MYFLLFCFVSYDLPSVFIVRTFLFIADLFQSSATLSESLQAIIDSVLVPPYNSAQPDVGAATAQPRTAATELTARSRYIQMPAIETKATMAGAADAADASGGGVVDVTEGGGGAFTYNCTAGMVFRETTV